MANVRDIIAAVDRHYALSRAESWDRVGLQIGDATASVNKVLVAHEVTAETIEAAQGFEALLVYHPPIFRALDNLDLKNHTVRLAARCLQLGLNVIAAHTALDNAPPPGALGDALAAQLDLRNVEVLSASGREALWKIVVFTPPEALDKVSAALWMAGAGHIGNYDRAGFRTLGTGTFRPLEGADPYSGEVGMVEEAEEWRLEVIVPEIRRDEAVGAMIDAHPYEEVAYDVYPLHNTVAPYGAARYGELETALSLASYARHVQVNLQAPNVRMVDAGREIRKVACVPGSGASYLDAAVRAGCDCLVTGDIKHHDALKARALGLSIIDTTHTATERAAVPMLAGAIASLPEVEVQSCVIDTNPFAANPALA